MGVAWAQEWVPWGGQVNTPASRPTPVYRFWVCQALALPAPLDRARAPIQGARGSRGKLTSCVTPGKSLIPLCLHACICGMG